MLLHIVRIVVISQNIFYILWDVYLQYATNQIILTLPKNMATNLAISRAQYEAAKNAIAVILSSYSGSRNSLKSIFSLKRRLGTLAGSQIPRDYNMLIRKEKIVKKYEESLVQNVERYPHCNYCNCFPTNAKI